MKKSQTSTPVYVNSQAVIGGGNRKLSLSNQCSSSILSLNNMDLSTLHETETTENKRGILDDRYFKPCVEDDENNNSLAIGLDDESLSLEKICESVEKLRKQLNSRDNQLKERNLEIDQITKINQELMEEVRLLRKIKTESEEKHLYKSNQISSSMSNLHSKLLGSRSKSKVKNSTSYTAGIANSLMSSSSTSSNSNDSSVTPQKTTGKMFAESDLPDDHDHDHINNIVSIKGGHKAKDSVKFWSLIKDRLKSGSKKNSNSAVSASETKKSAKRLFAGPKPFKPTHETQKENKKD